MSVRHFLTLNTVKKCLGPARLGVRGADDRPGRGLAGHAPALRVRARSTIRHFLTLFDTFWHYIVSIRHFLTLYFTIWKNNTSPEARILWTFRTPPKPSTLKEASFFDHFWVDPGGLNYMGATPKSASRSRFFEVASKIKKHYIHKLMARKWFTLSRHCFTFIFQKSTKRWGELDFCGVKNASKVMKITQYAFWRSPRTIRRWRSGFHTGIQNRAKLR